MIVPDEHAGRDQLAQLLDEHLLADARDGVCRRVCKSDSCSIAILD
jgi:hypothetical protein